MCRYYNNWYFASSELNCSFVFKFRTNLQIYVFIWMLVATVQFYIFTYYVHKKRSRLLGHTVYHNFSIVSIGINHTNAKPLKLYLHKKLLTSSISRLPYWNIYGNISVCIWLKEFWIKKISRNIKINISSNNPSFKPGCILIPGFK